MRSRHFRLSVGVLHHVFHWFNTFTKYRSHGSKSFLKMNCLNRALTRLPRSIPWSAGTDEVHMSDQRHIMVMDYAGESEKTVFSEPEPVVNIPGVSRHQNNYIIRGNIGKPVAEHDTEG